MKGRVVPCSGPGLEGCEGVLPFREGSSGQACQTEINMWEGPEWQHDKKFSSMGCLGVEGVTDDVAGL